MSADRALISGRGARSAEQQEYVQVHSAALHFKNTEQIEPRIHPDEVIEEIAYITCQRMAGSEIEEPFDLVRREARNPVGVLVYYRAVLIQTPQSGKVRFEPGLKPGK